MKKEVLFLLFIFGIINPSILYFSNYNLILLILINSIIFIIYTTILLLKKEWKNSKKNFSIKNIFKKYFTIILFEIINVSIISTTLLLQQNNINSQIIIYFLYSFIFIEIIYITVVSKKIFEKKIYFWKKFFFPKDFLFHISIVIIFLTNLLIWKYITNKLEITKIFIAILIWYIFFISSIKIFKAIWKYWIKNLFSTKLYIVISILMFFWSSLEVYTYIKNNNIELPKKIFFLNKIENKNITWNILTWKNNTKKNEIITWKIISWTFIESWIVVSWENKDIQKNLNITISDKEKILNLIFFKWIKTWDNLTYKTAIIYLMKLNNIKSTKKNIKFKNISKTNEIYSFFYSAYKLKLIWTDINPEKYIKCDNYIVMKWIINKRNTNWIQWNIFYKYFQIAKNKNQLNWCKQWQYLTLENL